MLPTSPSCPPKAPGAHSPPPARTRIEVQSPDTITLLLFSRFLGFFSLWGEKNVFSHIFSEVIVCFQKDVLSQGGFLLAGSVFSQIFLPTAVPSVFLKSYLIALSPLLGSTGPFPQVEHSWQPTGPQLTGNTFWGPHPYREGSVLGSLCEILVLAAGSLSL